MGCMDEALSNLFPTSWLDPYGNMPLNDKYTVQIDITQVKTDDGIKVTAVKTPPRAGTTSIQDAISMALGMSCDTCEMPTDTQKPDNQDKKDGKFNSDKPDNVNDSDKMNQDQKEKDEDQSESNRQ